MKKILLVIGASSDVGIELIKESVNEFDKIYAHYFSNTNELEKIRVDYYDKIELIQADFCDDKSTEKFMQEISDKEINHVVHLSSIAFKNERFSKLTWEDFKYNIDTQLKSLFYILKSTINQMSKNKFGKVVIMLSSCTYNMPPNFICDYVTTKYALLGFMKALSVEYANKGITINGISPSMMETKFLKNIHPSVIEQSALNAPTKRNARVSDVVPMIKYLLSDSSSYITGQNILISGGNIQ